MARVFKTEPDIRHAGLGNQRGRVLQKGNEHFRPIRKLPGDEDPLSDAVKRRAHDTSRTINTGNVVTCHAAVSAARHKASAALRITAGHGRPARWRYSRGRELAASQH